MSIDSLLLHPLVVALGSTQDVDSITCRTSIRATSLKQKPKSARGAPDDPTLDADFMNFLAVRWLRRRGVDPHCTRVGLWHPIKARLWVADIVGERHNKPVLAVMYFSRKRRGRAKEEMREYTRGLAQLCENVYKLKDATTALINVYSNGRVEGEMITRGEDES